jgi:hypothetical protein
VICQGILEQNTKSRTEVGTSDFFRGIQEKLVPKTFSVCQGILKQNTKSRTDVGTSEFFPKIQEKLVPKTFSVCHVTVREYSSKIRKAAFTL